MQLSNAEVSLQGWINGAPIKLGCYSVGSEKQVIRLKNELDAAPCHPWHRVIAYMDVST